MTRSLNAPKLPHWLSHVMASLGGAGLFVIAFFDSSVLSFPFVTDLLFIEFVIHRPGAIAFYIAMAVLGSICGCIWLYLLAKKGGEMYYSKHRHRSAGRIQLWVRRHAFLSVFVPAILPPPMPFKAFVLAEGVLQVPLRKFVLGIVLGRMLRYAVEGILALEFGTRIELFMTHNKLLMIVIPIALIALIYFLTRWLLKPEEA